MVPTGTFCPVFGGKEIRGTDMIGEIEQFTEYLQNVKQMSRNTVLSYRRDLLQMAAYLNADRSALSRTLSELKKEGLLDYYKNTFKLL